MADTKITALTADTSPTSDDLIPTVTDPAGTPANRKVTLANAITKGHGLSDGLVEVASGVMGVATSGTDYAPATSGSGILKGNGSGGFSTATANTDYFAPKANLVATTAPTSANDNTEGYSVGSVWVDVTGDKSYIAVDVSTGASVWNDLTASASGGISNVVEDLTPQLGGDLDMNTHNITATGPTTITPTEVSYLDGVSSNIQTQLNAKQASGATLTSLEALTLGAGDILYATAADTVTDLAIGTANQVLAVNAGATAPEWKTISSGGQTTYDAIVASSGGDYTTLGAAITAASAGWSIFVKEGTYSESAISTALNNLTIVGENPNTSILSLTSTSCVFSGTGVNFRNIGVTATTGNLHFTGAKAYVTNIVMTASDVPAATRSLDFTGQDTIVDGIYYTNSKSASTAAQSMVRHNGQYGKIINSTFVIPVLQSGAGNPVIGMTGTYAVFSKNIVYPTATQTSGYVFGCTGTNSVVNGNVFKGFTSSATACTRFTGAESMITGNTIEGGIVGILCSGGNYKTISGNVISDSTSTAMQIDTNSAQIGTVISGNTFNGAGTTGLLIESDNSYSTVTGNTFTAATTAININSVNTLATSIIGNNFSLITSATAMISDSGSYTYIGENPGLPSNLQKIVLKMKNTSGATVGAGALVTFKSVAAGNEITTTTTAGDQKVFGVALASITNNTFGYVQTQGKTTLLKVDGTADIAIGDFISAFTTVEIGQKASAGQTAIAIALEAYITDDSLGVIDALIIPPRYI